MIFVLFGEESFLMKDKLKKLKKQYQISEKNLNISTYYMNESRMDDIIQDALTPSFLSDYKMVIMKNPLFLTGSKQKNVTDTDIDKFISFISNDIPELIFVIYLENESFDKRKKVYKELKKYAQMIECAAYDHYKLLSLSREAFKKRETMIDDDALDLLLERCLYDLSKIQIEIEKLSLYSKELHYHDVEDLVVRPIEDNVFQLANAINEHRQERIMQIYQDLIKNNQEPIQLIGLLASSLRSMYEVKMMQRKGYQNQEIASILKMNSKRVYAIGKSSDYYDVNELLDKLEKLAKLDIKIKTGKIDKFKGLELFLLGI